MPKKIALLGLSASEIVEALALSPSFRGKQIFSWLSKGVDSFEKMKNLDKTTLEKLNINTEINLEEIKTEKDNPSYFKEKNEHKDKNDRKKELDVYDVLLAGVERYD